MKDRFYRLLTALSRRLGHGVFLLIAGFVAAGYFLLFPRRRAASVRFYRSLFPGEGGWAARGRAWRQYQAFVRVFLDRFRLAEGEAIPVTRQGWEHLEAAVRGGRGGILLMSHLGGWEVAARLLQEQGRGIPGLRLMLFLGAKGREQIEARQKRAVAESGIRVLAVPEGAGADAGLGMIEGLAFLREGGLVSLTGDRLWGAGQRAVTVRFAGGAARLPEAPFALALASGAPLLLFFGWRTAEGGYHLAVRPPRIVAAADRAGRGEAIRAAAQAYADELAAVARAHPEQWFHFTPFLRAGEGTAGDGTAGGAAPAAGGAGHREG